MLVLRRKFASNASRFLQQQMDRTQLQRKHPVHLDHNCPCRQFPNVLSGKEPSTCHTLEQIDTLTLCQFIEYSTP